MIATGVIHATRSTVIPYVVSIPLGEKKQRITFCVDNHNDIPYPLRQAMDCGESVAGVFKFVEKDQFATYIRDEEIERIK